MTNDILPGRVFLSIDLSDLIARAHASFFSWGILFDVANDETADVDNVLIVEHEESREERDGKNNVEKRPANATIRRW